MVKALGARVILEVQAPLKSLCQTLAGVDAVIDDKEEHPAFDLQTPLLSLPLAFATTLETIPCQIPYLAATSDKIAAWAEYLGEKKRLRVGLTWSGNPKFTGDHNRAMSFVELASLLDLPCDFISLHKAFRDEEEKEACEQAGVRVVSDRLSDFAETAALVMNLDLVISVDTSVVHLAGALGKPVWVLLPFSPDFRWLLDRADSPWYPTARLFRQQQIGQWQPVLAEVKAELSSLLL